MPILPFLLPAPPPSIPLHYSSSYTSDADSEPSDPSEPTEPTHRRWWTPPADFRRRRRRRDAIFGLRALRRRLRWIVRILPQHPTTILLSLLTLTVVALITTLTLMRILNPDKEPLPWRAYCVVPTISRTPPVGSSSSDHFKLTLPHDMDPMSYANPFPPPNLDDIPPAGVFLAVFSTDSAVDRRILIRTTWASHPRSRAGAYPGDGGNGTSRTIVRFILGKPSSDWERRVQLEAETYNDMIILPIYENMNLGKTYAFFTWAGENAWVPAPTPTRWTSNNESAPPPPLAAHDPPHAVSPWVRPDYVVKADDDSFVMLAELESRLRVELDEARRDQARMQPASQPITVSSDPLIYWGYLVKNRFMAGELYSLSFPLVQWVAREPSLHGKTHGAEDKRTADWIRRHPQANEVRWASERCWIYDHPRAGTVYSHGYLFPSEVSRVRPSILSLLRPRMNLLSGDERVSLEQDDQQAALGVHYPTMDNSSVTYVLPASQSSPSVPSYSYSSVTSFGKHYTFPTLTLTPAESIEALVEGSWMSGILEGGPMTAKQAWAKREGRRRRYEGQRVGGTVVVHFIKRNEWWFETAMALLGGEDEVAEVPPP